ncbi:uncharacterized protein LOC121414157 [Lytechinus variegatus]|uniref:uncharacterized protein LOC121414157 n=1 Tax=Lytechinus variegatus TaxID=7654 RepID=UPI001BB23A7D|nr:uncharacterized protein LOC121414157 [Lytechinus variegatus]
MAAEAVEKLNRELDCAVCINTLKNPKSLSCGHSFCEECLKQCDRVRPGSIKCPMCRETITLPVDGVSGLKSDPLISRVIEVLEAKKNSTEIACDACGDSDSILTTYCRDCLNFICDSCASSHSRMKILMKDHRPVPLEKIVNGSVKINWMEEGLWRKAYECDEHIGEIRRFFCRTCKKRICRDCIVLDHTKPDHDCTTVQKMFLETQEKMKDRLENCQSKQESVEAILGEVEKKEAEINQQIHNLRENIRDLKARAAMNLNKTEEELLQKVEVFEGKLNLKLNAFRDNLKTSTDILTRLQIKANDIISAKQVADLSRGPFLPEEVLKELEEEIASEVTMTISRDLLALRGTLVQGPNFPTPVSPFAALLLPPFWQESQMFPIPDKDIVKTSCDDNALYVACKNGIYKKLLSFDAEPSTWTKLNQDQSIKQVVDMAIAVEKRRLSVLVETTAGDTKFFRIKLDAFSKSNQVFLSASSSISVSSCQLNNNARIAVDFQSRDVITDSNPMDDQVHSEPEYPACSPFGTHTNSASFNFNTPSVPTSQFTFGISSSSTAFGQPSTTKSSSSVSGFKFSPTDSGTKRKTASQEIESKAGYGSSTSVTVYRSRSKKLPSPAPMPVKQVGGFAFGSSPLSKARDTPAKADQLEFDNFKVPTERVKSLAAAKSGRLVFLQGDLKAVIITDDNGTIQQVIKEPGRMYLSISCTESDALYVLSASLGSRTITLTKHSLNDGRILEYIIDELDVSADFKSEDWPVIANHGNDLVVINIGKVIRVYSAKDWDILDGNDGDGNDWDILDDSDEDLDQLIEGN